MGTRVKMKTLLRSSDDKTVRILRRVLSDLEIAVEHCSSSEAAIRKITRERFEAIVVDCPAVDEARSLLRSLKSSPGNSRAIAIVLVESAVGMRGGFEIGAHFVLHKPLSSERAKASFRAVRALMKRERRRQLRVTVQVAVECRGFGSGVTYRAKTLDLCEGGMAIQFPGPIPKEKSLRFLLDLPGMDRRFEVEGEWAWEGHREQAGVRFKSVPEEQREVLRQWLNSQLPEPEQDDPPVSCVLTDLSPGGCYLQTISPFPHGTRVSLAMVTSTLKVQATGIVRVAHPEFGMGLEFVQTTPRQHDEVRRMIETLRANGDKSPELHVKPEGLESSPTENVEGQAAGTEDPLVDLFRYKAQIPVETFLQQMREQRQTGDR